MLTTRIIPCLDCKDGRVVKGVNFKGLKDAGCPVEMSLNYQKQGADEIVLLDVSATPEGRGHQIETVKKVRMDLNIPLTCGGGVRAIEDAGRLLQAGADKVSVNTAAVNRPELVSELASKYGSQCTVVAIDATRDDSDSWQIVIKSGRKRISLNVVDWAREVVERGAGEILLTSWDRDGTKSGYELNLLEKVSSAVSVPIIASGGAANSGHLVEALNSGADALLAASIFHYAEYTVNSLKNDLRSAGKRVRL